MKPIEKLVYSDEEIENILEKLKALFQAVAKAGTSVTLKETVPVRENASDTSCEVCGEEKVQGQYGLYCRGCYLRRKEAKFQRTRRW